MKKGGRMRSANRCLLLQKASERGAINRSAKQRLGVRSASAFGNSRRSSQVAALHVDVVYWNSSFCDDTLTARLLLTSHYNSTMRLDAQAVKSFLLAFA